MVMWNNKVLNKALNSLKARQKCQYQIDDYLNSHKKHQNSSGNFLLESVKEGG